MKKLEKLKGKTVTPYRINLNNEHYLENLQKNKYLVFNYQKGEKFVWKFIKTEKILGMVQSGQYIVISTNVEGKAFMVKNEFYVTKEFTLAKVKCDEENGTRKNY